MNSILQVNTSSLFLAYTNNFLNQFVGGATCLQNKSCNENYLQSNDAHVEKKTWQESQRFSGNISHRENSVRNLVDEVFSTNRETTNCEKDLEMDEIDSKDNEKLLKKGGTIKKKFLFFIIFHVFMLSGNSVAFLSTASLRKQSIFGYSSVYLNNILLKQAYFSESIITFVSDVVGAADEGLFESCMDKLR